MTYISECKAPEISELGASLLSRTLNGVIFQGHLFPENPTAHRLLTAYFLTTDKAVREYSQGRAALVSYIASSNQTELLVEGLGRFETCISATKRALRLLDKIKAHPQSPTVEKTTVKFLQNHSNSITAIRNAIEHIDNEIVSDSITSTDMAHILAIDHGGSTLEISVYKLGLSDLCLVVRKLHQAGVALIESLHE